MPTPDIAESEWAVMEVLWEDSPLTAAEVARTLRPTTKWADNTVRTLLTRLVEKGALKTGENAAGTRMFRPSVSRKTCVKAEGDSFLKRIFGGAAKPLLIHFAQNSKLTTAEVKELKRLLDESVKS